MGERLLKAALQQPIDGKSVDLGRYANKIKGFASKERRDRFGFRK
jgi:hypothetical protein